MEPVKETTVQRIVIFGPYKSGTTALFYKIRNSLPGDIRTLFEQDEYVPDELDDKRWVLAKTILGVEDGPPRVKCKTFMEFEKKVCLVRDPRDLVISGMLFTVQQEPSLYNDDESLLRILKILRQKENNPDSISVSGLFKYIIEASANHRFEDVVGWIARQYRWLLEFESQLENHFVVKYEDLVDGNIEGLEDYLEFPLKGKGVVDSVHDHVPRTMGYNNWKNWFLKADIDFFKPLFGEYIRHYGYAREWELNRRQIIPVEHCSEYVERTVNKKRKTPIS